MTLSRYQAVFLILVVVVGCAVAAAIYYIERVYEAREDYVDKVREGRTEELIHKPPPKPPAAPPLSRTTSRAVEVLVVGRRWDGAESRSDTRAAKGRRSLVIRGNGEFVRFPASPDEPGPLVTGLLDRAQVDDLLRRVMAHESPPDTGVPLRASVQLEAGQVRTKPIAPEAPEAAALLALTGKQMNRGAVPDRAFLRLELADVDAAPADAPVALPWPLERLAPDAFRDGAELKPESDRGKFHRAILQMLGRDARFVYKGRIWRVAEIDLLPP